MAVSWLTAMRHPAPIVPVGDRRPSNTVITAPPNSVRALTWHKDHCRIRTGHRPENMTRRRRFAIGVIKMHAKPVATTVRKLHRTPCLLLDYPRMSANTRPKPAIA